MGDVVDMSGEPVGEAEQARMAKDATEAYGEGGPVAQRLKTLWHWISRWFGWGAEENSTSSHTHFTTTRAVEVPLAERGALAALETLTHRDEAPETLARDIASQGTIEAQQQLTR